MFHSAIAIAAGQAGYAAFLRAAAHDERHTRQSLQEAGDEFQALSDRLYDYTRQRKFPPAETLWRKAHEFDGKRVERTFDRIAEAERMFFVTFRAVAEALEPYREKDPEPSEETAADETDQSGDPDGSDAGATEPPAGNENGAGAEPAAGDDGDPTVAQERAATDDDGNPHAAAAGAAPPEGADQAGSSDGASAPEEVPTTTSGKTKKK